jgi:hypothetical protein
MTDLLGGQVPADVQRRADRAAARSRAGRSRRSRSAARSARRWCPDVPTIAEGRPRRIRSLFLVRASSFPRRRRRISSPKLNADIVKR